MERILDFNNEFDINLFDEIVSIALGSGSEKKKEAEEIIIRFKEIPSSWTKIDYILKNSTREQSKFIALQILEENVMSKWSLFNEETKMGLRQYVFTTVIERSGAPSNIILQKFNSVLLEIVKRDWPLKWPTFINDLITVSQSTSMAVSRNTLVVLKNLNEQLFMAQEGLTTARQRLLQETLQREYFIIFRFISLILEYSEKQELDDDLLENCLDAFRSFCKSMPVDFIVSTKIVDNVMGHLNSPHSIAALNCLLEIIILERSEMLDTILIRDQSEVKPIMRVSHPVSLEKVIMIQRELLGFFKQYLGKFTGNEKPCNSYRAMGEDERLFVRKYAKIFATLYALWMDDLSEEDVQVGLSYLVELSKIDDSALFKDVFFAWEKIIYDFYSEYSLRVPTSRPLKRTRFSGVLQAMLPVFIQNFPKPEEVFILLNDLGEIVKDRNIETAEIEFYNRMKQNLYYLSFSIENFMQTYLIKKIEKHITPTQSNYDLNIIYKDLNQLCWTIGALGGAFEEVREREFFVSTINTLLTICEVRPRREERAIVASDIMFIIGQYNRFLKFNNEFMFVVLKKLFEFMGESYAGIKEMACDNFYKICEKCPNQFFTKRNGQFIFESVLLDLSTIINGLDFCRQRILLEGLLIVLKNGPNSDPNYVLRLLSIITNQSILNKNSFDCVSSVINDRNQVAMISHLIESYTLGFKLLPRVFNEMNINEMFVYLYSKLCSDCAHKENAQILKNHLCQLFTSFIDSRLANLQFFNILCARVLADYKISYNFNLLKLAEAMVIAESGNINNNSIECIQRLQFYVSNLIFPSIPLISKADENIDLSIAFFGLFKTLLSNSFGLFFSFIMDSPSFDSLIDAILFALSCIRDISSHALECVISLCQCCLANNVHAFFLKFYFVILENVLGLIFDKDMKSNYSLQVDLMFFLISHVNEIQNLSNDGNNIAMVEKYIFDLFSKNLKNVTPNSLQIFVEGIFKIRTLPLFTEHINDFNVKINEYGNDEDADAERAILNERISRSNN